MTSSRGIVREERPLRRLAACRRLEPRMRALAKQRGALGLRAARLPPPQLDNMSSAGGMLLGFDQWEGDKKAFGGARRMNAAAQTAGQLADDRKPLTALDGFRCRAIVRDPALYDVACKHQLHSQFWMSSVELCMPCHISQ